MRTFLQILFAFTCFHALAVLVATPARALDDDSKKAPAVVGENECPVPELPKSHNWEPQEHWAWKQICLGEIADLRSYLTEHHKDKPFRCDTKNEDGWPKEGVLSNAFLNTILRHPLFRRVMPNGGIKIRCARFTERLDLSDATFDKPLVLLYSRFDKGAAFSRLKTSSKIDLQGSAFHDTLDAESMEIGDSLFMQNGASFKNVRLLGAKIGRHVVMDGSTFDGKLNADSMEVGDSLSMRNGARFKNVRLLGAKIGRHVVMDGSTFDGKLNADHMDVGDYLFMQKGARFKNVRLLGAKIGRQVSMNGSTFDGQLNADHMEVGGHLFMRKGARFKDVRLPGAKIGGDVDMSGSTFKGILDAFTIDVGGRFFMRDGASFQAVNLNGANIAGLLQLRDSDFFGKVDLSNAKIGELHLASPLEPEKGKANYPPPRWGKGAQLILRNAHADALNDTEEAWRNLSGKLDLVGFTYDRLGGLRATIESPMSARHLEWLLDWLAMQKDREDTFSPHPYEQLAKVLRDSGYLGKADAILFAARNHQRDSPATPWLTKAKLWVQWGLIGYGYHNWIALLWFAGLTGLGTWACGKSAFGGRMQCSQRYWYSFDMALPLIGLNKRHEVVKLTGGVLVYFYFHKMIGFVLVSFLVAGLSGLTK